MGARSHRESLSTIGWATNRLMLGVAAFVVTLQLVAIYTPRREFLDLETLGVWDLLLWVGSGALLLTTLEAAKAARRRRVVAAGRALDQTARFEPPG